MIFNYILLMKNVLNQNNGLNTQKINNKKPVDLDFLGKPWQTCFLQAKSC